MNTEQLNIEGKRSGDGFVAHKAMLVNALSRALAARLVLLDFTIGRKGLLNYFKSLAGSNIIKVVPANGSASEAQAAVKRLKVVCGSHTSHLDDGAWIKEATTTKKGTRGGIPLTFAEVRVCPSNAVKPNVGANELAEALNRVLPFTAKDDNRPVLQCVNFTAKDGKLNLISADGFRLAVVSLDYGDGDGQALINRDELKGIANALKRAKRARVSFEGEDVTKPSSLILDTELIRYKWVSVSGNFPEWQKLIPTEVNCSAHFDTVEAIKATRTLKALSDNPKDYPIDLTIGNGKVVMANPDNTGQADISADTDGEGFIRIDGGYLADALKACGGMVDFKMTSPISPMLFSTNGYQLVTMPMGSEKAKEYEKAKQAEAVAETTVTEQVSAMSEEERQEVEHFAQVADGELPDNKAQAEKPKRSRKRDKVAVA